MIACARWLGRTSATCTRQPDGCLCADEELATAVAAALEAAKTRDEIIAASQQIQHVQGISRRDRLGAIVRRRLDEFKQH